MSHSQLCLFLLKAMQQIDDDISDSRKEPVQALWRGILTKGVFENGAEKVWYWSEI